MVTTPAARAKSADEIVEQLREILATNAAGNAQLASHLSEFVRDMSRELGRGQPVDAAELFSRWLDFNLKSYSLLNMQSFALLDGLLSVARDTLLPSTGAVPAPGQEPRVDLRMSGRVGERVTTSFVIENQFDQPLEVGFECDDLATTSGQTQPAALVDFNPPKLAIPARNQAVGQAGVTLKGDFVVGETYRTTIRLLGFATKELGLLVTILPPADKPVPSPAPSALRAAARSTTRRSTRSRGQSPG